MLKLVSEKEVIKNDDKINENCCNNLLSDANKSLLTRQVTSPTSLMNIIAVTVDKEIYSVKCQRL